MKIFVRSFLTSLTIFTTSGLYASAMKAPSTPTISSVSSNIIVDENDDIVAWLDENAYDDFETLTDDLCDFECDSELVEFLIEEQEFCKGDISNKDGLRTYLSTILNDIAQLTINDKDKYKLFLSIASEEITHYNNYYLNGSVKAIHRFSPNGSHHSKSNNQSSKPSVSQLVAGKSDNLLENLQRISKTHQEGILAFSMVVSHKGDDLSSDLKRWKGILNTTFPKNSHSANDTGISMSVPPEASINSGMNLFHQEEGTGLIGYLADIAADSSTIYTDLVTAPCNGSAYNSGVTVYQAIQVARWKNEGKKKVVVYSDGNAASYWIESAKSYNKFTFHSKSKTFINPKLNNFVHGRDSTILSWEEFLKARNPMRFFNFASQWDSDDDQSDSEELNGKKEVESNKGDYGYNEIKVYRTGERNFKGFVINASAAENLHNSDTLKMKIQVLLTLQLNCYPNKPIMVYSPKTNTLMELSKYVRTVGGYISIAEKLKEYTLYAKKLKK